MKTNELGWLPTTDRPEASAAQAAYRDAKRGHVLRADGRYAADGLGTVVAPSHTLQIQALLYRLFDSNHPQDVASNLEALNAALDGVALSYLSCPGVFAHPLVAAARAFAIGAHEATGITRSGSHLPYASHCAEVVCVLSSVSKNPTLLSAGWLHDVIDDTKTGEATIAAMFGAESAGYVRILSAPSHESGLLRSVRKSLYRDQLAQADAESQSLKAADIISNVRTIRIAAPGFAPRYLQEKRADVEAMTRAAPLLSTVAMRIIESELLALKR